MVVVRRIGVLPSYGLWETHAEVARAERMQRMASHRMLSRSRSLEADSAGALGISRMALLRQCMYNVPLSSSVHEHFPATLNRADCNTAEHAVTVALRRAVVEIVL
jgi:hypothetical protein